ncbi:MAG: M50 family metallopeptidase [Terracidiphilus sp.]
MHPIHSAFALCHSLFALVAIGRPVPGDETRLIFNRIMGMVGVAAPNSYRHGGAPARRVSCVAGPWLWLQLGCLILLVLFVHESGHAIAAIALRMKVTRVTIGPFRWSLAGERWHFQWGGHHIRLMEVLAVPLAMNHFRRRRIIQLLVGPGANLATGLVALIPLYTLQGPVHGERLVVSIFAVASLTAGIFNLIPFRIGSSGYSDGARIYQLASGGLWAEYQRLQAMMHASVITPRAPREFDIRTIQAAAGTVALGGDQLLMYLTAYACFFDRGEFADAAHALDQAQSFCNETALDIPAEWYSVFVFGFAYLRKDAVTARYWWTKLEADSIYDSHHHQWTSLAALLWSEGRLKEAELAWKRADLWAALLPPSGYAEMERKAVTLLRAALAESSSRDAGEPSR